MSLILFLVHQFDILKNIYIALIKTIKNLHKKQ